MKKPVVDLYLSSKMRHAIKLSDWIYVSKDYSWWKIREITTYNIFLLYDSRFNPIIPWHVPFYWTEKKWSATGCFIIEIGTTWII